jgi:DNA modification methylase
MSRIETIAEGVTVHLGDCREILPSLGRLDAIVTDPPYGIKEAAGKNKSRTNLAIAKDYGDLEWDNEPPPAWLVAMLRDISQWQVIFGGNFYDLPPSPCWLVWDKKNTGDFADCELAWTNLPKAVRKIEWLWNGMIRKGSDVREHPTQKPLGVMAWALDQLPDDVRQICDPFMGSGTTGVAAIQKGLQFIGIEREAAYFDAACQRLTEAVNAPKLFSESAKPLEIQQDMLVALEPRETFGTIWKEPYWNEDGTAPRPETCLSGLNIRPL